MHGPKITDDAIGILLHDRRLLAYLRVLDLRASKVTLLSAHLVFIFSEFPWAGKSVAVVVRR